MKRFVTTAIATAILLTACSSTAFSIVKPEVTYAADSSSQQTTLGDVLMGFEEYRLYSEQQAARQAAEVRNRKIARIERSNAVKMQKVLSRLERTAGNTPYVFAGSSPSGWDCSGLVAWTYRHMGVTLPHSAIAQAKMGRFVKDPVPGDIVAYYYRGSSVSTHSGIYIGNGKVIHALKPGTITRVESAERGVVSWNMYARYVRLIPLTNPPERVEMQVTGIPISVAETAS